MKPIWYIRTQFSLLSLLIFCANDVAAQSPITFTNITEQAEVHFHHEDGRSYKKYFVETLGSGVALFDYNNDDLLDLYLVNGADLDASREGTTPATNHLYRNNGDGTFVDATTESGVGDRGYGAGVCVADYDNDGWLDFFVAKGHIHDNVHLIDTSTTYTQVNHLFQNNRDGTFTNVAELTPIKSSRGSAVGDIDNDGDLDLVISNVGEAPDVLRNDSGNLAGRWLNVKLIGSVIGSRVIVTAGLVRQIREVRSGSSYLSQSDFRFHFGLGEHEKVDIAVRWASGKIEKFEGIETNRFVKITEGEEHLWHIEKW